MEEPSSSNPDAERMVTDPSTTPPLTPPPPQFLTADSEVENRPLLASSPGRNSDSVPFLSAIVSAQAPAQQQSSSKSFLGNDTTKMTQSDSSSTVQDMHKRQRGGGDDATNSSSTSTVHDQQYRNKKIIPNDQAAAVVVPYDYQKRGYVERTKWWVLGFLFTFNGLERLMFATVHSTSSEILTSEFNVLPSSAKSMTNDFAALVYLMPLICGICADSWFGNVWMVFVSAAFYSIGGVLLCWAAGIGDQSIFLLSLYMFLSVGAGVKSTLVNLAADQVVRTEGQTDESYQSTMSRFFNAWTATINIGAIVSFTVLSQIATEGLGAIPQEKGFMYAYIFACIALFIGFCCFLTSLPFLRPSTTRGRICQRVVDEENGIVVDQHRFPLAELLDCIWRDGVNGFNGQGDFRGALALVNWFLVIAVSIWTFVNSANSENAISKSMSYVTASLAVICFGVSIYVYRRAESWVSDREIGIFLQLTATQWSVCSFIYTGILSFRTGFLQSTCQYDLRLFGGSTVFNGVFLFVAVCLGNIVTAVILNVWLEAWFKKKNINFGIKSRLATGAFLFMTSLAIASGFEYMRRTRTNDGGHENHVVQPWTSCPTDPNEAGFWGCRGADDAYSHCAFVTNCGKEPSDELLAAYPQIASNGLQDQVLYDTCAPMSDTSGWLMFLPFFIAGMAQIIMIASILDYTYAKCPTHFRSTSVGIVLLAQGPGAASLNSAVNQISADYVDSSFGNLNFNHLEYVFLVNLILVFVGFVLVFVADPKPVTSNRNSAETDDAFEVVQPLATNPQAGAAVAGIATFRRSRRPGAPR